MMRALPSFHPGEDLLLDYSAGALPEAPALLVATHASTCRTCTRELTALDELGGVMVADAEPVPLPASTKQSVLERVAALGGGAPATSAPAAPAAPGTFPEPLRRYAGGQPEQLAWKWLAPGAYQCDLALSWGAEPLRLVRLRSGFVIPKHMHTGRELTLVLCGELSDELGSYGRGDVSDYDTTVVHRQRVTSSEPCICLIANEGHIVPKTLLGRILARISGV